MSEANTTTTNEQASVDDTNSTSSENANSIRLWLSHPTLYRAIMTFAVMSILLGFNFLFTRPTFNPYDIDKSVIGSVFLALGLTKVLFLHGIRNLRALRLTMSFEVAFSIFWGIGTSLTYFQGRTSLQLAILYGALALFEMFLLVEPFANPMNGKKGA